MSMIIGKKDVPIIDEETKIPFFSLIFCSLNILIWIRVEVEKEDFASYKIQKKLIFRNPNNLNT